MQVLLLVSEQIIHVSIHSQYCVCDCNCMFYKRALIGICSILWQIDLFLIITIIFPNRYNFACSNTASITYFRMEKDAD